VEWIVTDDRLSRMARGYRRRDFLRLTVGGATGLSLACSSAAPASPKPAPTAGAPIAAAPASPVAHAPAVQRPLDVVKRATLPGVLFHLAIAKARGYFEEVGIDEQPITFSSGAEQTQALATGDADIAGTSNTAAFFNMLARGVRQPFVSDQVHLERDDRYFMFVLRPDLANTIRSIPDLRGRKLASASPTRDGGPMFVVNKMFAVNGMQLDDVEWERVPFPDILAALANRSIDGAIIIEPYVTLGKTRDVLVPWLSLGDFDPGAQIAGMLFSERFARERPDVARRWMVASNRGAWDYNDFLKGRNREQIVPILAAHTGLAPEIVEQVGWGPLNPDGWVNVESVVASQQQLVEWGTISQALPREQLVDHQYVEYALQQLGPYGG
jgi:NitT/TauT family transport system substrate-binding protein